MSSDPESFTQFDISEHEKDKLVGEVIRYILFKSKQTSGCPIRREELTQLITGKNYRQRNLPAFVINEAKSKLASIFGYELRELQRSRASQSQQAGADAKSYVILSQLADDIYSRYVEDKDSAHLNAFTLTVVGIVHLSGGKVTEENLWHHMRRLGLRADDENHPNFGSTKQLLETVVQQRYLQKEKVNGPEGNIIHYELAERALDGPFYDRLKEFVTQLVQKEANLVEVE